MGSQSLTLPARGRALICSSAPSHSPMLPGRVRKPLPRVMVAAATEAICPSRFPLSRSLWVGQRRAANRGNRDNSGNRKCHPTPSFKVVYLEGQGPSQLHVISVKPGQGLSIKETQGNLWPLKEIPSPRSVAERRAFVRRHVSHTFGGQISEGSMKTRFMPGHCNVSVGAKRI
ncbi:hypothetical protein SKAU_G00145390 [Synaphobranchus kaupii]|uniref:Uncharacterized protein n=1 Tax=Synaphobranchus kaupii TaxID=118154 RepID=A0A9Q1FU57_SYNKA|nr:hypothetical protein SKAU_G00145390 [Synaphobranchus kaupii]